MIVLVEVEVCVCWQSACRPCAHGRNTLLPRYLSGFVILANLVTIGIEAEVSLQQGPFTFKRLCVRFRDRAGS